jgi:hypothetical protein
LLFQLVQGGRCVFGIDPPALDRSLALFERGRKLFIGQIGIRISVSRRCNEFPQSDRNGIYTFSRDLFAIGGSPTTMPSVWAICRASVMRFPEFISHL